MTTLKHARYANPHYDPVKRREETEKKLSEIQSKFESLTKEIFNSLKVTANTPPKLREFLRKQETKQLNSATKKMNKDIKAATSGMRDSLDSLRSSYASAREKIVSKYA